MNINLQYFADAGTLSFANVKKGESISTRSFTPVDCTDVENMSNWTIVVDGTETARFRAKIANDGTVFLMQPGIRIILR